MSKPMSFLCLAAAASLCWLAGWTSALPAHAAEPARLAAVQPLPSSVWTIAHARHLLFRAGFGSSAEEVERLHALGLTKAVDRLVDVAAQPALELPLPAAPPAPEPVDFSKLTPQERQRINNQRRRADQQRMNEIRAWWVRRMIETPRPLEEKMTLFWHGLLTSGYQTVRSSLAMQRQNELFRRHAVGNYGELLHAIVRDGAMLRYLDNNSNVKGRPNENLAREILELFSMGEGNYSEQDIKEAARALTGYTVVRDTWEFRFVARSHDDGEKTIFGKTGNWNGDQLVDLILEQPATARYIVGKLFVYFVHESPDERTIDELASIFRESDYEIAPVLKALFTSREFYSERAVATHIKSPVEFVVGTVRSLPFESVDYQALSVALRNMGQDLFEPPNVKGWDGGRAWLSSNALFARQNFAVALIQGGGRPGLGKAKGGKGAAFRAAGLDLAAFCRDKNLRTPEEIISYFGRTLFAAPLTDKQRGELLAFLGDLPPAADWTSRKPEINAKLRQLMVLMLSLPQYELS